MPAKRKEQVEFRYYELKDNMPVLALLGDSWKMEYGKDVSSLHFHNYMEIGWCHYGTGALTVETREIPFEPDMFTVIPKNIPHKTISDKGNVGFWEYLFVDTDSFLKELYRENAGYARKLCKRLHSKTQFIHADSQPELACLFRMLFTEMSEKREFYREKVKGLLHSLLMELTRNTGEAEGQAEPRALDRSSSTVVAAEGSGAVTEADCEAADSGKRVGMIEGCGVQITAALHYIEEHYAEEFPIKRLADVCHMSETHFRRVFLEIMNMTPLEYVSLVRVEAACELIQQSDLTMAEISEQTGFGVPSTFNRNFKKLTGVSPYQWKKDPGNFTGRDKYQVSALRGWQ